MAADRNHSYTVSACENGECILLYVAVQTTFKPFVIGPLQSSARQVTKIESLGDIIMLVDTDSDIGEFRSQGRIFIYSLSDNPYESEALNELEIIDSDDLNSAIEWEGGPCFIGNANLTYSTMTDTYRLIISQLRNGMFIVDFFRSQINRFQFCLVQATIYNFVHSNFNIFKTLIMGNSNKTQTSLIISDYPGYVQYKILKNTSTIKKLDLGVGPHSLNIGVQWKDIPSDTQHGCKPNQQDCRMGLESRDNLPKGTIIIFNFPNGKIRKVQLTGDCLFGTNHRSFHIHEDGQVRPASLYQELKYLQKMFQNYGNMTLENSVLLSLTKIKYVSPLEKQLIVKLYLEHPKWQSLRVLKQYVQKNF